jgi:hypothetical protein
MQDRLEVSFLAYREWYYLKRLKELKRNRRRLSLSSLMSKSIRKLIALGKKIGLTNKERLMGRGTIIMFLFPFLFNRNFL